MIINKNNCIAILFFLAAFSSLAAQSPNPERSGSIVSTSANIQLILEYTDGSNLQVISSDKSSKKLDSGIFISDEILVGDRIITGNDTSAELRLQPNGSIIKLGRSSSLILVKLAKSITDKNVFQLVSGKLRMIAAVGGAYEIRTNNSVSSVRGTDFSLDSGGGIQTSLTVVEGLIQFGKAKENNVITETITVAAGESVATNSNPFLATKAGPRQLEQYFTDLQFIKLRKEDVPTYATISPEIPQDNTDTNASDNKIATSIGIQNSAASSNPPAIIASPILPAIQAKDTPSQANSTAAGDTPVVENSPKDNPSTAITSVNSEGKGAKAFFSADLGAALLADSYTYGKLVLQPGFEIGKFKMAFYIPLFFRDDLFDPLLWYRPGGNLEWSMGSEYFQQGRILDGVIDLLYDLALKIKYVEYGTPILDPFFFKLGNFNNIELGHGLLVRKYANDTNFPSIRQLGLHLGLDVQVFGLETLVNNLVKPEIFATRLYIRPAPKTYRFAFGLSGVLDINPGGELVNTPTGNLMLLGTGVDLDFPIIENDSSDLRLFTDMAVILPFVRDSFGPTLQGPNQVSPGLKTELLVPSGSFKNWGLSAGILHKLSFLDWRAEFRYSTGAFVPGLFDSQYDTLRSSHAAKYAAYLSGEKDYSKAPDIMGLFGELNIKLMDSKLIFGVSYLWPMSANSFAEKAIVFGADELSASLTIKKGLIPSLDISGSIYYKRKAFAKAISDGNLRFIDSYTAFGGEVQIPVPGTPNLDIIVFFKSESARDPETGQLLFDDESTGTPRLRPSIGVETRFHF